MIFIIIIITRFLLRLKIKVVSAKMPISGRPFCFTIEHQNHMILIALETLLAGDDLDVEVVTFQLI